MSKLGKKLIESAKEAATGKYGRVTVFLDRKEMEAIFNAIYDTSCSSVGDIIHKFNPADLMFDAYPETEFWKIAISPVEDESIGA